jgi:glycosyltransferase involved in cell wall biosynthesis
MEKMERPDGLDWELIVVNNNCTDDTDQVLSRFADRLPLKRLFEPEPGHTNAKNTAVEEARGDYLLWTDDDVLVDPGWLVEYEKAFKKWPEAAFFGGPIRPWLEEPVAWWLADSLGPIKNVYAFRDFGENEIRLSAAEHLPYGANFAIRAEEQRAFMFDPRVGRRPGSMQSGEETTVLTALLDAGHHGRWVPLAPVKHWIPKDRQTLAYVRGYFRGQGEGLALAELRGQERDVSGIPRWIWRAAIEEELLFRIRRWTSTPDRWLLHLSAAARAQSRIWTHLRHRFKGRVQEGP